MSGYLSRLKQIENEENFHNSTESEKKFNDPPDSSKESGLPSVSFVSSVSEENKKNSDIQLLQIEMIQAWLCRIGESVEEHFVVIDKCKADPEALAYFLKHARGESE